LHAQAPPRIPKNQMEIKMDRRRFLGTTAAAGMVAALPACATVSAGGSEDGRLRALLDRIFYARLEDSPETRAALASTRGIAPDSARA
jgi:hypothetical protein